MPNRCGYLLTHIESVVQDQSRVHSVLFIGDHGGSTLLPPNVTNEFPEYGTMEDGGESLRTSLEFDAESLPCCPQGYHSGLDSITEGPKDVGGASSQRHLKEQSLQPIDSLILALKATEARIASGTLQSTKVQDKDAVSHLSVQQMDKELDSASHQTQTANKLFPAGQEKLPDIPLSAEVTMGEGVLLRIQEDLLSGEAQGELSQVTANVRKGALRVQGPACPGSSLGSPGAAHSSAGSIGFLREGRSDLQREHPGECDRGSSTGRPGRVKHVEFEGVEILWTGGKKRETRQPADFETSFERTTSLESKGLSKVPSHLISSAGLCNSVGFTKHVGGDNWRGPSERPATSLGTFSPAPLVESGEDEVFLKENKGHLEEKPELEGDKER